MSKYTRDYCKRNKVAVVVEDDEQFTQMIVFSRGDVNTIYNFPGKGSMINAKDGNYVTSDSDHYQRNGYEIISFDQVNFTDMSKIIGYKAPFDINSLVSKNTVYVGNSTNGYCPKGRAGTGSQWCLCAQIVEKWEAVYEEGTRIGGYDAKVIGTSSNSRIKFGCQEFTRAELMLVHRLLTSQDLNGEVTIHGVKVTTDMIVKIIRMLN